MRDLNTSHVNVNLHAATVRSRKISYLNTSHVNVNPATASFFG